MLILTKWIYSELVETKNKNRKKTLKIIDLMKLLKMPINLHGIRIVIGI